MAGWWESETQVTGARARVPLPHDDRCVPKAIETGMSGFRQRRAVEGGASERGALMIPNVVVVDLPSYSNTMGMGSERLTGTR